MRDAAPGDLWRYTGSMLYLIENPVVREAFFPSDAQPLAVEPAVSDDETAIAAILGPPRACGGRRDAGRVVGGGSEHVLGRSRPRRRRHGVLLTDRDGAHRRPEAVRRSGGSGLVGSSAGEPGAEGQTVLGLRRWLDSAKGEQPCAVQAASWLDVKRTYMALRPALRRIYVVVNDVPTYWPVVEKLGFRPIAEQGVEVDGITYTSVVLDFGPGSVDGWLAGLVGAELGVADEAATDETARELAVRGERVALTPLEFGLFSHLREREGTAVSRQELLREVWGTEYSGGSNVVDAVVRSLRRKLGSAAAVGDRPRERVPPPRGLARGPPLEILITFSCELHRGLLGAA